MPQTEGFSNPTTKPISLPSIVAGVILFCAICIKLLLFPKHTSRSGSKTRKPLVVLGGPMGSGKTKLWTRLAYGCDEIETVTSMLENSAVVRGPQVALAKQDDQVDRSNEKRSHDPHVIPLTLVDTPAHPRLRAGFLSTHLNDSTGVIFVIDTQSGLSGRGLRDTGESLNLVLSYLLLMSYQRPECPLPKLAIYLNSTSKTSKSSLQPDHTEKTIPKIHASLNKELNRRRIGSTTTGGSASAYMSPVSARLEAIEAIPVNETSSFWVALKRLFQPDSIKGLSRSGKSELYSLPDEEGELMRLLDDEEDQMIGVDRSLNGFERYEKLSGHDIHWISSTPSDPHGVKDLWSWLEGV